MSILSRLFNKKIGVPEVDLNNLPIAGLLVQELQKNGLKQAFKALSDDDVKLLDKVIQIELYNRKKLDRTISKI